jgi:outer membrane protein TolC
MMTTLTVLLFMAWIFQQPVESESISLSYCYEKAYENYPISKNIELQQQITDLNVRIANTGNYPEVAISGKASYQSEVTDFALPGGAGPPAVSKDQYEAALGLSQPIYNGGRVDIKKSLERARGEQEINAIKVEMHKIRTQIDQVYFGILLSQQQAKITELLIKNLREQIKTVRSRVENGILLPSQKHILEAELLKVQQDSVEIQSNIRAGYQVLGEIIGEEISTEIRLSMPSVEIDYKQLQPQRPEYALFNSTREAIKEQKKLAQANKLPTISAFGNAAFGRPGLNFLNDDFHDYYIVGLRLRWNVWDALNADKEQEVLQMKQQQVMRSEQAFSRQLNTSLDRIGQRIASIRENMQRDEQIIELREMIVKESASQLENGVITATEYITELNQKSQARLSLFLNEVRLSQAQVEYMTTLGINSKVE